MLMCKTSWVKKCSHHHLCKQVKYLLPRSHTSPLRGKIIQKSVLQCVFCHFPAKGDTVRVNLSLAVGVASLMWNRNKSVWFLIMNYPPPLHLSWGWWGGWGGCLHGFIEAELITTSDGKKENRSSETKLSSSSPSPPRSVCLFMASPRGLGSLGRSCGEFTWTVLGGAAWMSAHVITPEFQACPNLLHVCKGSCLINGFDYICARGFCIWLWSSSLCKAL